VAEIEEIERDNFLFSDDQAMTYAIEGEMKEASVVYPALDLLFNEILEYELPWLNNSSDTELVRWNLYEAEFEDEQTGFRYLLEWGGEWELTLDVFRDLGIAMLVALFAIYALLVAQFRSFKIPLLILGTVPLGLIGVLPGYAVLYQTNGIFFNATSMIGVIALAGIVVNNAIIMVEYIKQLDEEGKGFLESVKGGATTRMRPIVLTALTTILGSLTLVGDPVWAGLGWSIVLGMAGSTVLTLVVFPTLYYHFMHKDFEKYEEKQTPQETTS
jgi:multidrug efflux pump subunit AcrB